jgi:hypothetical protein
MTKERSQSILGLSIEIMSVLVLMTAMQPVQIHANVDLTVTTAGGPGFRSLLGQSLPEGCVIRVGVADLSDTNVRATLQTSNDAAVIGAVLGSLGEISASGTVKQAGNSTPQLRVNNFAGTGEIFGAIEEIPAAKFGANSKLVIWVFNASTPDDATEWGIFTSSAGWETPPDLGAQVLSTGDVTEALRGSISAAGLTLASVRLNSYATWAAGLTDTRPQADRFGDGVPNILKYLTAADPHQASTSAPVRVNSTNGEAVISVDTTRTDIAWELQGSTDLVSWQTLNDEIVDNYGKLTNYRTSAPMGASRWFYRVSARLIATP